MRYRKFLLFLSFLLVSSLGLSADERPLWLKGEMPPQSNTSYYFSVNYGEGLTIKEAQTAADMALISQLTSAAGITVSGETRYQIMYFLNSEHSVESETGISDYNINIQDIHLSFKVADTYITRDHNQYSIAVLYEVAKNPDNVKYEPVEYTNNYGARGLWRSAIIPGWGQMYKKQYAKGAVILAVEAAAISVACVAENQRSSYMGKIKASTDPNAIKFYQNKANESKNLRNGLFIGAAAVYVYNLVDAIAAKGRTKYKNPQKPRFAFAPVVTPQNEYGLALNITF
ncbi:MAG: hypothetical protein K2M19_05590 [Muribaculaceae bacterium]|nr:hypothetical protein [Muribaculaceae bacterium]